MRIAFALVTGGAALLAGCGQAEEQVRSELRSQMQQRCTQEMAARTEGLPNFDTGRYCSCITERTLEGRSLDDVRDLFADKGRTAELGREAATQCLQDQMPGSAAAQASAPTNEAARVVPPQLAPAASSQSADPEEESAEEAADESQ